MKIVVDGVFFQIRNTGIARVWRSLLKQWSTQPFSQSIVLLDRGGTAPQVPSIQSIKIPLYGPVDVDSDRQLLQQYCDEVGADLFVSTYYTTPVSTPSVFFGHDMIPELMGVDLNSPMWQDKHRAIHQGIAHIVVSENTKKDLQKLFPKTQNEPITVAHCGLSPEFSPPSPSVIQRFRDRYKLHKPYVLWVGERLGVNGYKNSALVFQAMELWERYQDFSVVCTGDGSPLEPSLAKLAQDLDVRSLQLSEAELVAAYGGAHCLAYTSRYEGFGLPVLEAMGCGCPVVTCACGSIPEVAGNAALYVSPDKPLELTTAFERLTRLDHRQSLIGRGRSRSRQFSWETMADKVSQAFQQAVAMGSNQGNNQGAIASRGAEMVDGQVSGSSRAQGSKQVSGQLSIDELNFLQVKAEPLEVNRAIATLKAYGQDPQNSTLLEQVRMLRRQLITPALQLGTAVRVTTEGLDQLWTGEYATLHQALRHSGLLHERLGDEEQRLLDRLCQVLASVPDTDMPRLMAVLTAATLLRYPYQLPGLNRDWSTLNRVASRYTVLLLEIPNYFGEPGDLERFRGYTETLWQSLRSQVLGNRNDLTWQKIAQRLMNYGTITPLYFSEHTGREIYRDRAQVIEAALESSQPEPLDWRFGARPRSRQKIRIGILRNHWLPGTESFSTLPVFEHLNRESFEVVLYTLHPTENDLEHYCGDQVAGMVALPSTLSEQVNAIRTADLDILWIGTNVTMVTNGITLLAAFRLGRVQVTSINSPTTTGFRNVDIYFGGYLSLGKSYGAYHETAIALPGSGICFSRPPLLETSSKTFPTREDWGANDTDVVLLSGANFNKLLPELRAVWTRILAALPNGRLVLYPYNPNWQHHYPGDRFRQDFEAQLQAAGVDPGRLVILQPMAGMADIRQCLRQGDLYLDSLPYGGATSLLDPIDVDLPMVVYEGEALRFRQASSLLRELNEPILQACIATTVDEYVATAIALGQSPARRQAIARALVKAKGNRLPFLDSGRYSRALAPILETLVNHWTQTKVPALSSSLSSPSSSPSSALVPSLATVNVAAINLSALPTDRLIPVTVQPPQKPETPTLQGPAVPPLLLPPALTRPQLQQLAGVLNLWRISPEDPSLMHQVRQWRSLVGDTWGAIAPTQAQQQFQQVPGQAYQILVGGHVQKLPWTDEEKDRTNAIVNYIQGTPGGSDRLTAYMVALLYFAPGALTIDQAKTRLPEWFYPVYANIFETAPQPAS